jgi:hypothetical protein
MDGFCRDIYSTCSEFKTFLKNNEIIPFPWNISE